jgi:carbamoyltransferase
VAHGPSFDEQDLKEVIENCRLEYVYEPDWPRVFARVSRWVASGSTVAWFNGAQDFGGDSLGSRSILADPSHRYARENMNVYLLGRPPQSRLPISIAPSAATNTLAHPLASRLGFALSAVKPDAKAQLAAGLDSDGQCLLHTPDPASAPEFVGLLEAHRAATGTPGLLNATLEVAPGQIAETPRDAIRAAFGSAVDALVMGRFLIGKDYWLMRQPHD